MELSLLGLLTQVAAPKEGGLGELAGEGGLGAETEGLYSFEQWLSDMGVQDGVAVEMPGLDGELQTELVPNLVLAQGEAVPLATSQVLSQLTGIAEVDAVAISSLNLSRAQADKLADMMRKYLQRPDTAATLGESQRAMLQQMIGQLQQAGKAEQPIAPVLKPLMQVQGVSPADMKERAPVIGQVMKWLQQVLRDAAKPMVAAAPINVESDARMLVAAQGGFPGDTGDAAAALETTEEDEALTAVPVIAVPFLVQAEQEISVELTPNKGWAALADWLIEEASAIQDEVHAEVPVKQGKAIMSADFAQLLASANARDAAMEAIDSAAPELTLKAAAALVQPAKSDERTVGASPLGDAKTAGMSAAREKALAQADGMQAVAAVMDVQANRASSEQVVQAGLSTDGGLGVGQTGTFQVGQSNHLSQSVVAQYATARVPVPEQVQVAVRQATRDGVDRITIQLQPEELGRIDVRLDMHADGRAHIVFTVDKADTFDQLQRDARFLEKALQDAGVQTDAGSMEFNLRQQNQQEATAFTGGEQRRPGEQDVFAGEVRAANDIDEEDTGTVTRNYTLDVDQGLDIRV